MVDGDTLPGHGEPAKVLVVDDDRALADLMTEWVTEKWACATVYGGNAALDAVDETYDVVVLDRQMPDLPGDDVLDELRERDLGLQVVMVSAITPDFDILGMGFDDYLEKPVERTALQHKIEELLVRRTYHPDITEYLVCSAKRQLLETAKPPTELQGHDGYVSLLARADELRQAANATLGRMTQFVTEPLGHN